jgi:TonB family protein
VTHSLQVENRSADTLECFGEVSYDGLNAEGRAGTELPGAFLPHEKRTFLSDRAKPDARITNATVTCNVRKPRERVSVPKGCEFHVLDAPDLGSYYPAVSRRLSEQGPVVLTFVLPSARGTPTGVAVAGSSLFARLDQAAIDYVSQMVFESPCPATRYELLVRFKLED